MSNQYDDAPSDFFVVIFFLYMVIFVISGFVTLVVTSSAPTYSYGAITKAAYGLESGKAYPLRFGKRIEGSSGYASASASFFSSQASVNIQPASALSVAFHHGPKSYILELPMKKIVFLQKEGVPETIKISLSGKKYGDRYGIRFRGILLPSGPKPLEESDWFPKLKRNGQLGEFLASEALIDTIQVTISPENYSKILG